MTISWNRSLKTGLATAGAVAAFAMVVPATASADIVDDALAMIPAGQISCEEANQYWTTEAEYNSYAAQARTAAVFHPRGGEINDALNRIDEAANRCGLKGGDAPVAQNAGGDSGTNNDGQNTGGNSAAPINNGGTGGQDVTPAPAENNAPAAPAATGQVFTLPVPEGTPTTTVAVADLATVVVPDVEKLIADTQENNPLAQLAAGSSN